MPNPNTAHKVTITELTPNKAVAQGYHGGNLEEFLGGQVTAFESEEGPDFRLEGYIITDTSVPNPHLGGRSFAPRTTKLTPKNIEELPLEESLFSHFGVSRRTSLETIETLSGLCIFTCADALALGSTAIAELAADSGKVVAQRRMRILDKIVTNATGISLPKHRADPLEQHQYYTDIHNAGLALALPGIRFQRLRQFKFREGHRHQTVGSLVRTPLSKLGEQLDYTRQSVVMDFIVNELGENVIKPFNRAGKP